ncbi:MAG: hypothetical protein BWK76_00020 [Desulfobulbaceae bacterium A2]|nr:MAG: hypothetical protein BWK76_00020 [Desulfobulbaceae bacterium A2]
MTPTERRQHPRVMVKNGALAIIDNLPGTVIDISEGGLSLHHMVFEQEPRKNFRLDLFFQPDEPFLTDLPVELTSEIELEDETDTIRLRRYGLRFCELNDNQRQQLKYFILHNAVSLA